MAGIAVPGGRSQRGRRERKARAKRVVVEYSDGVRNRPDGVFPGNPQKPYFYFVSQTGEDKSTATLLEMAETKNNFEIVHWRYAKNRTRSQIERKGERIKSGK